MPLTATDNSALTSDEVREIQSALKMHGIDPGPVDGIYGPWTAAAIIAFKRSIGFVSRPWVGPMTWNALMASNPKPMDHAADDLPPWIREGLKVKGWHERADNAELRSWLKSDGHALGDPAVFPWCGDFAETCIRLGLPNEPFPDALGKNPYWALNWRAFGQASKPFLGSVFSISRNGGGHVGFVVGEDATRYYCLGGNQSNRVSIAPIDKGRFPPEAFRWPVSTSFPQMPLRRMASTAAAEEAFG